VTGGANSSAYSVVRGEDVDLTVGGALNISAGSAYAQIESISPTTITLTFPNLASGGYFVNGVEGALYDGATDSGFFANGQPATVGNGLVVTYGGAPVTNPVVDSNNNQNLASLDKLDDSQTPGGEPTLGNASDPKDAAGKDKKELPVCN
jgi:hypothetical protein